MKNIRGEVFPEIIKSQEIWTLVVQWFQDSYNDGSLKKWALLAAAVLFLLAFFKLWRIPEKGVRWGENAEVIHAGDKKKRGTRRGTKRSPHCCPPAVGVAVPLQACTEAAKTRPRRGALRS